MNTLSENEGPYAQAPNKAEVKSNATFCTKCGTQIPS